MCGQWRSLVDDEEVWETQARRILADHPDPVLAPPPTTPAPAAAAGTTPDSPAPGDHPGYTHQPTGPVDEPLQCASLLPAHTHTHHRTHTHTRTHTHATTQHDTRAGLMVDACKQGGGAHG